MLLPSSTCDFVRFDPDAPSASCEYIPGMLVLEMNCWGFVIKKKKKIHSKKIWVEKETCVRKLKPALPHWFFHFQYFMINYELKNGGSWFAIWMNELCCTESD